MPAVIAAGGTGPDARTSSSIYTISTNSWAAGPNLKATLGRTFQTMTAIAASQVLAAGGDFNNDASAEIYDKSTNQWTLTSPMRAYRTRHRAVLLTDGSGSSFYLESLRKKK